jgi:hypothetical protein
MVEMREGGEDEQ